ncbi:hypothetical protein NDU88_007042 [Pleurodeles waltl]|uniref:Uncharacterized protein n=1 Tax=Pleurodeles waltl TaxID=8319 RepID=A0AAV7RNA8_PLEWA|nr:hypothetical protein NDU88_007042 [Pleurodeles waltl]
MQCGRLGGTKDSGPCLADNWVAYLSPVGPEKQEHRSKQKVSYGSLGHVSFSSGTGKTRTQEQTKGLAPRARRKYQANGAGCRLFIFHPTLFAVPTDVLFPESRTQQTGDEDRGSALVSPWRRSGCCSLSDAAASKLRREHCSVPAATLTRNGVEARHDRRPPMLHSVGVQQSPGGGLAMSPVVRQSTGRKEACFPRTPSTTFHPLGE